MSDALSVESKGSSVSSAAIRSENAALLLVLKGKRTELEGCQAELKALKEETENLRQQARDLNVSLEEGMKQASETEKQAKEERERRERLASVIENLTAENEALREQKTALTDALRDAIAERQYLAMRNMDRQADLEEFDESLKNADDSGKRLDALLKEQEEEQAEIVALQGKLEDAKRRKMELDEQEQTLQNVCEELKKGITELEEDSEKRQDELKAALEALQEEMNTEFQENRQLKEQVSDLEQTMLDMKQRFQEQKSLQTRVEMQLARAKSEVFVLTLAVDQAKEDAVAAQQSAAHKRAQSVAVPMTTVSVVEKDAFSEEKSEIERKLADLQVQAEKLTGSKKSRSMRGTPANDHGSTTPRNRSLIMKHIRDAEEEHRRQQLIINRLKEQESRLLDELTKKKTLHDAIEKHEAKELAKQRQKRWRVVAIIAAATLPALISYVYFRLTLSS